MSLTVLVTTRTLREMKRQVLTYFMWAYQPHFLSSMEFRARQVLGQLGMDIDAKALLVGVRVPDVSDDHPVCLEPEKGDWDISHFKECLARAEEIFATHPDQGIYYGDEPRMRDKPEIIRRKSVRQAVEEALVPFDTLQGRQSFCGAPIRIDNYHVAPVLQVSRLALAKFPRLPEPIKFHDWTSATSLVEALIWRLLSEASEALGTKEPGRYADIFNADVPGLLREAGNALCNAIPLLIQDFMLQGVFEALNEISALKYEGGETRGTIAFAPSESPAIEHQVRFLERVSLSSQRMVRKIVEMSGADLACVCDDSAGISGLATVSFTSAHAVFRALFIGHYRWELYWNDTFLMRCTFGVPSVPAPRLTEAAFVSNVRRVLVGLTEAQGNALWDAVSASMEQRHGTMIVVSDAAPSEARRLQHQTIAIEPTRLTPALVRRVSGIDGAILVDRDCRCHALGVILDGLATDAGDPSRGARFNSAIRYVGTARAATVCLVVSEDGHVNMVPTLRPQIEKGLVQAHVERLASLTVDNYHETRNWLDCHRFYLTASQCEEVSSRMAARAIASPTIRCELSPSVLACHKSAFSGSRPQFTIADGSYRKLSEAFDRHATVFGAHERPAHRTVDSQPGYTSAHLLCAAPRPLVQATSSPTW